MTDTNNGWPGKPGVPLNPEKDGYHRVKSIGGDKDFILEWSASYGWITMLRWSVKTIVELVVYIGPVITLDEETALQARVAELEGVLSGLLKTFEGVGFRIGKTYPPRTASYEEAEQHYAKNYQGETALFMYQQWCQWRLACMARAALEGKKDE